MATGTVNCFNSTKGFGFITQENVSDVFVHKNEVDGFIDEGDKVEFELGEGQKGPCATNVKKVLGQIKTKKIDTEGESPNLETAPFVL